MSRAADGLVVPAMWAVAVMWAVALLAGCGAPPAASDVAIDQRAPDARPDVTAGEAGSTLALDFVARGCTELTSARCSGSVPLTLTFVLVSNEASAAGGTWSFGDGSTAQGTVVQRVFDRPGVYTVSVTISHAGGTRAASKTDYVVAQALGAGGACFNDAACSSQRCVCNDGSCPAPLDSGLCLAACATTACLEQEACVLLGTATPAAPAWRTAACHPLCNVDAECTRFGFRCRLGPTAAGWRRVCLPPFPAFIGEPCRDADGARSAAACLGDVCLAFGAAGYCSAACEAGSCPDGTRCVELGGATAGAQRVCLLRCAPGVCGDDPGLACREAGGSGAHAFNVVGPADPAGTMYCAARPCLSDADCGQGGHCATEAGGYCATP